ncbi:hypothetical protein TWF506_003539 [Arthrobotrys conoides]|uniref:LysM domain-containing protein n=1 Tax=Arthrobotrys conoides TaxID=74498 RepID=A0AAN8N7J5_9PEZI
MRQKDKLLRLLCLLIFSQIVYADFVLFPYSSGDGTAGNAVGDFGGFGNRIPISTACQQALNRTITCDQTVQQLAVNGYSDSLNFTTLSAYSIVCTASCKNSLTSYGPAVIAACGSSTEIFGGLPVTYRGDVITQWQNSTCQQDPGTGLYCADFILNQMNTYTGPTNIDYTDLPTSILCTPCHISRWRALQASSVLGYNEEKQAEWIKIQQRCGLSYPTAIQPDYIYALPNAATYENTTSQSTCISGKTYTVKASDTCHSIAGSNSVAEGTLRLINQLLPDCSNLAVGQSLCLPNACTTYTFKQEDTCASIAGGLGTPTTTLISYNPSINEACSNTGLVGTYICINSPFTEYTPIIIENISTNTGIYADTILPPPGATARGTTRNCGKWYQIAKEDICQIISLKTKIALNLFYDINPNIDSECSNLVVGLWYCVQPTENWRGDESVTTRTTLPPPGPTESGTSQACYEWHKVVSGDYCGLLESSYGISLDDLIDWNPTLKRDCSNLLLGKAYCVSGGFIETTTPSSTTTSKSTTTSTRPPTTTSSVPTTTSTRPSTTTTTTTKPPTTTPPTTTTRPSTTPSTTTTRPSTTASASQRPLAKLLNNAGKALHKVGKARVLP